MPATSSSTCNELEQLQAQRELVKNELEQLQAQRELVKNELEQLQAQRELAKNALERGEGCMAPCSDLTLRSAM